MPNPELMKLMQGGAGGKTGAPPPPAPAGGSPSSGAPVGAPMTTPQANEGEQQAAMVDISMAFDLLEKSMSAFGAESKAGQALHKALGIMVKEFGEKREKAKPLVPAELMQLMQGLPQGAGGSPEMKAMAGGGMPPGGAPPPGAGAPPMPMAA